MNSKEQHTRAAGGSGASVQPPPAPLRTASLQEEAAAIVRWHRELVRLPGGDEPAILRHVEELLHDGASPTDLRLAVLGALLDGYMVGENRIGREWVLNLGTVLARPHPDKPERPSYHQRIEEARRWSEPDRYGQVRNGLPDAVLRFWSRRWRCDPPGVFERLRRERAAILAAEEQPASEPPAAVEPVEQPAQGPPPYPPAVPGYVPLFSRKEEPGVDESDPWEEPA